MHRGPFSGRTARPPVAWWCARLPRTPRPRPRGSTASAAADSGARAMPVWPVPPGPLVVAQSLLLHSLPFVSLPHLRRCGGPCLNDALLVSRAHRHCPCQSNRRCWVRYIRVLFTVVLAGGRRGACRRTVRIQRTAVAHRRSAQQLRGQSLGSWHCHTANTTVGMKPPPPQSPVCHPPPLQHNKCPLY